MTVNKAARIEAIDILRGLSLAFMILVNNPGSWRHIYSPLQHANWHGMTPTDLVFPFFLFVVGASMSCSFRHIIEKGEKPVFQVLKRGLMIVGIGFLLHIYPFDHSPEQWRFMGVLQRIGLCFILTGLLILFVSERWLISVGIAALLIYTIILTQFSSYPYSLEHNVVAKIDLVIFGANHMWKGKGIPFDPEGLLSTIPATVTVISGFLFGKLLQHIKHPTLRAKTLLLSGLLLAACGLVLSYFQPINKYLWTPTFVLVTAGIAGMCLAFFVWLWEVRNVRKGLDRIRVYGTNPILVYILAYMFTVTLEKITLNVNGQHLSTKAFVFKQMAQIMPEHLASMFYGVALVIIFYLLSEILYRKNIIIKI